MTFRRIEPRQSKIVYMTVAEIIKLPPSRFQAVHGGVIRHKVDQLKAAYPRPFTGENGDYMTIDHEGLMVGGHNRRQALEELVEEKRIDPGQKFPVSQLEPMDPSRVIANQIFSNTGKNTRFTRSIVLRNNVTEYAQKVFGPLLEALEGILGSDAISRTRLEGLVLELGAFLSAHPEVLEAIRAGRAADITSTELYNMVKGSGGGKSLAAAKPEDFTYLKPGIDLTDDVAVLRARLEPAVRFLSAVRDSAAWNLAVKNKMSVVKDIVHKALINALITAAVNGNTIETKLKVAPRGVISIQRFEKQVRKDPYEFSLALKMYHQQPTSCAKKLYQMLSGRETLISSPRRLLPSRTK